MPLVKAEGKYKRGPKLSPEQIDEARLLVGEIVPKIRVGDRLGGSRWTRQ